jgi:hypothetical protein
LSGHHFILCQHHAPIDRIGASWSNLKPVVTACGTGFFVRLPAKDIVPSCPTFHPWLLTFD